jgi:hypothetical protein
MPFYLLTGGGGGLLPKALQPAASKFRKKEEKKTWRGANTCKKPVILNLMEIPNRFFVLMIFQLVISFYLIKHVTSLKNVVVFYEFLYYVST